MQVKKGNDVEAEDNVLTERRNEGTPLRPQDVQNLVG